MADEKASAFTPTDPIVGTDRFPFIRVGDPVNRTATGAVIAAFVGASSGVASIGGLTGTVTIGTHLTTAGGSLDATGFLTGNQTITLSGDVTGAGATAITATVAKIGGFTLSGMTPNTLIYAVGAASLGAAALDSHLAISGGTLTVSGFGTGTVTSIVAGTGLGGGTINTAGTITNTGVLAFNQGTINAVGTITAGSNTTLNAGGTLSVAAPGTGAVTSVATGAGLTGGPVIGTGTILFANIAANSLLGNPGTASAAPSTAVAIGNNLTLTPGGTLSALSGASGPYGEMFITNNSTATVLSTLNTFVKISPGVAWTAGLNSGFTFATDTLTATVAGTARIVVAVTFTGIASTANLDLSIFQNGSQVTKTDQQQTPGGSSAVARGLAISALVTFGIGDTFDLRAAFVTSTAVSPVFSYVNLSIQSTVGPQGPTGGAVFTGIKMSLGGPSWGAGAVVQAGTINTTYEGPNMHITGLDYSNGAGTSYIATVRIGSTSVTGLSAVNVASTSTATGTANNALVAGNGWNIILASPVGSTWDGAYLTVWGTLD